MRPGAVAYLQIPAADVDAAATFYTAVFGWTTRRSAHGSIAFDDTSGAVSGTWVTDRAPSSAAGVLVYVRVGDVSETLRLVAAEGGRTVTPRYGQSEGEYVATFEDPAGNELGIFQE